MTNRDRGFNQLAFLVIKGMIFLHVLDAPIEAIAVVWFLGSLLSILYIAMKEKS